MKDFLEFLNTSNAEELTTLPGITPAQAEKIISARPFTSLEDSARVKNLTEKRLARLKVDYETSTTAEQADAGEQAQNPETEPVKTGAKLSAIQIAIRVVLALLILGALFVLFYFGIPLFKERILNPLQSNTARVGEVASQQAADVERLSTEIAALQARISTLEVRADGVDQSLQSHTETLAKLEEMQATLQSSMDAQRTDLLKQIDEQLTLTRAIELLARSRLYLSQSNYGLAKTDAAAARNLLYGLLTTISADQANGLKVTINRLDLALSNLPVYPVVAVYDLDTAWQLLVDGLPNVPQVAVTPVIAETLPPTEPPPALQVTPAP